MNGTADTSVTAPFSTVYDNGEPLLLGAGDTGSDGRDFLAGGVDEAQVFDRALSGTEIAAIYGAGSAGQCKLALEPVPAAAEEDEAPNTDHSTDPVNTANGAFAYHHTDVAIAGRGPAPAFSRSYHSGDTRTGRLGPGWTDSYRSRLVRPSAGSPDVVLVTPEGRNDHYTFSAGGYTPPPGIETMLVENTDGSFTATEADGSKRSYDPLGRLQRIQDRYGNASALTYTNGRLTGIGDPAGRGSLTLSYDTCFTGRLCSITDWQTPSARTVQFGYDASGRLSTVTDREGKTTTYGYDGATGRLTTIADANGHVAATNTYDAQGRVATQQDALGLTTGEQTSFSYVDNGDGTRTTTVTYPATSFEPAWRPTEADTYDTQGRLTSRVSRPTSTETLTVSYTYDANSFRTSVTDARGNTTNFCYDVDYSGAAISGSRGNLTRRIDPPPAAGANRPVTLYQYDSKHNLTQTVPPKGVSSGVTVTCATDLSAAVNTSYATDLAYDATQTKLLSVTRRYTDPDLGALTAVTKFEYGDAANPGLVTKVVPPRGNTGGAPDYSYATSFSYFATGSRAGLLQDVTDAFGNKTSYDYDAVGRRTSMVDPLGNAAGGVPADHTWQYVYDNEDRVRFTKAPPPATGGSQLVTEFRYDPVGNRQVVIDPNGQVTKYLYDVRDSLAEVDESPSTWTDPAATPSPKIATTYQYDNLGNLSRVLRAQGDASNERAVDYVYDGLNRLRQEAQYPSWPSTAGPLVTAYTYDANGNRATLVDPLGQTTSFGYDALNRLTGIDYSDPGTPDVSYGYDANGNRTGMTDGTGSTGYSYDELDRLLSVTTPGSKTVGYRYDREGNRTKVIYSDGTAVAYSFDKGSRLASLADWAGRTVSYSYYPDGSLQTITNPNSTTAGYGYDNARRLTAVSHALGADSLARFNYTPDAAGNRTAVGEARPQLGPVRGWGYNGSGQAPQQVSNLSGAATIASGAYHHLVAKTDGTVWAWGANGAGQLGNGATLDSEAPVQASGLTGVTAVSGGEFHSLALKGDGTVWAWGLNNAGQLGDGTTTGSSTPVQVLGPGGSGFLTSVVAIAAGGYHSLALKSDGTVWAWGDNGAGQLGNDAAGTGSSTPVQVHGPGGSGFLSSVGYITAGRYHSLAVRDVGTTGTVWGWGSNTMGQLGDDSTTDRPHPVQVAGGLQHVQSVIANMALGGGFYHSVALKDDGTVWAWGYNGYGQVGDGSTTDRKHPVQVTGLSGIQGVAAGGFHTLAIKADTTVAAWGLNELGELGASSSQTCTVSPGEAYHCSTTPLVVSGLRGVTRVSGGVYSTLALKSDGTVWYWGAGPGGELGDGTSVDRAEPIGVAGLAKVSGLSAGALHTLAVKSDGTVWAWGSNGQGQLGVSSKTGAYSPVQVSGLSGVTAADAGGVHSLAVKSDGTAWAWGFNALGQLGDGSTTDRLSPVQVSGLSGVGQVAGGLFHSLARKTDGTVWAWGYNNAGQLGDGTTTNRSTPVQVSSLSGAGAIAAGDYHSVALKSDGTVWTWGDNSYGQLGNGSTTASSTPVQVSGLTGVVAIAAGNQHTLAVKSDGTVWAWGLNNASQLGTTTTGACNGYACSTTPVPVSAGGGLANAVQVAGGQYHSLARSSDGTVWAWGLNNLGQLGATATETCSGYPCATTPVAVSGLRNAQLIAAGTVHSAGKTLAGSSQSTSYTYDRLARLTGVDAPGTAEDTTYAYDPAGNRSSMVRGSSTSYGYDRADRITAAGSTSYTVNANGTTTARGADSFAYDQANRLTSATVAGQTSTYRYNGDGVRVSQTVAGFPTSYVTDVNRSLPVVLEDGGRKYVWGLGLAYAVQNVNGTERLQVYHPDGLGSVRAITDSAGAVVQTYRTDEFGVPLEEQGRLTQPFQYTGEPRDASGLVFLRARYYDPAVGRFLSRDRDAGRREGPRALNRFAYAQSNPLTLLDRSGFYEYRFEWYIGPASRIGSPEDVMRDFQQNPQAIFPFDLGGCAVIELGQECEFRPLGAQDPLQVTDVTDTSFTLTVSEAGGMLPTGASIRFRLFQRGEDVYLEQKAHALRDYRGSPLDIAGNAVSDFAQPIVAYYIWSVQANNLRYRRDPLFRDIARMHP